MAKKVIDLYNLTDEQKDLFVEGWDEAGGYMGDGESPSPWCCPWFGGSVDSIESESDDPRVWGAEYWELVQDEVFALIEEDERYAIECVEDEAREEMENDLGYQFDGFSDEELKDGRAAESYFHDEKRNVSGYTRTENTASHNLEEDDTTEEVNELIDFLIKQALDRAVFVVGSKSEARDLFDKKFRGFA